jgi:hypothetical protein
VRGDGVPLVGCGQGWSQAGRGNGRFGMALGGFLGPAEVTGVSPEGEPTDVHSPPLEPPGNG